MCQCGSGAARLRRNPLPPNSLRADHANREAAGTSRGMDVGGAGVAGLVSSGDVGRAAALPRGFGGADRDGMAPSRRLPERPRDPARGPDRVEVDHVRFERDPLPGGLWRHRAVRFVIDVARQREQGHARRP